MFSWRLWLAPTILVCLIIAIDQNSHGAFHLLAELVTVCLAFVLFSLAWLTYKYSKNGLLLFVACGYFWIGILDLSHALTFPGMNVFLPGNTNLTSQLWLSGRFIETFVLIAFLILGRNKWNKYLIWMCFGIVSCALMVYAFAGIFPDTYIEGKGLTDFKVYSEYTLIFALTLAFVSLRG